MGKMEDLYSEKAIKNDGIHLLRFLPEKGLYKYEKEIKRFSQFANNPLEV
jgi:hypothetical protein